MGAPVVLLVRYGELSLKSPFVRRQLEDRLAANVHEMFAANGVECVVRRERGRLWVDANDERAAIGLLCRVFGVVSLSPAEETASDLESLTSFVANYARDLLNPSDTFAIRPRRSGQHPYTSKDLGQILGQAVRDTVPGSAVDLESPVLEIHVEVRGPRAYVFHETIHGPGGLPLGSQGEVLAGADDEAGMVATWLVMRRGCRARVDGRDPFLAALRRWDPHLRAMDRTPDTPLPELAAAKGLPLVVATSALPTESLATGKTLVLRPLAGLKDAEIARIAASIRSA